MGASRHLVALLALLAPTRALRLSNVRCQWTSLRNAAPSARSGAACASGGESGVWLFGGLDDGRVVLDDLWHFDPSPGAGQGVRWREVPTGGSASERPGRRLCAAAAVVGGEFVVFGGWDMSTKRTLDDVWAYDVTGGGRGWRRLEDLPEACKNHVAITVGDAVVLHAESGTYLFEDGAARRVETAGDAPSPRTMQAAAALGAGEVVVFGGVSGGVELDDAYVLDVAALRWRRLRTTGPTPGPRVGAAMATAHGTVPFCYGGARKVGTALEPQQDLWALDADEGQWRCVISGDAAEDAAPPARNAACLAAIDAGTLLMTNGWQPFVRAFADTYRVEVDPGEA